MKRLLFWIILAGIAAGGGVVGYRHFRPAAKTVYRTTPLRRGDITFTAKESGTVQPVLSVQVGSVVSGPIVKVHVGFNAKVKKGQLLAEIDPLPFKAKVAQATAQLASSEAYLMQAKAKLKQALHNWNRAKDLMPKNAISASEYDQYESEYEVAEANVAIYKATVDQSRAALDQAETDLSYTKIVAPVDGIVTDRKVDPGQTLASTYQTPVLFVVAPDLEKRVYVLATADEADIGMIRDAQSRNQPVSFTVGAYPNDTFKGKIREVRLTPTTVENIVTYTVVVESQNPQLKLLPGMTVRLTFQIEKHVDVMRIPNAALRFHPKPEQVRSADRSIAENMAEKDREKEKNDDEYFFRPQAPSKASFAWLERKTQYVWITDGDKLSAVKVVTGLSDAKYAELVSGKLSEGQQVVTGIKP
ncbi:MAG: efflux RND transporter periplasmic adaptor subunit [Planctomycetaceae bacterium]|nr:efflux RND transporter periplasmic adaptor subunit [Planctomycetaceae bacterium]